VAQSFGQKKLRPLRFFSFVLFLTSLPVLLKKQVFLSSSAPVVISFNEASPDYAAFADSYILDGPPVGGPPLQESFGRSVAAQNTRLLVGRKKFSIAKIKQLQENAAPLTENKAQAKPFAASPPLVSSAPQNPFKKKFDSLVKKYFPSSRKNSFSKKTLVSKYSGQASANKQSERVSAFSIAGQTQPSFLIKGQLLLKQGLALLGDSQQLQVYHMVSGQAYESARIDYKQGVFDISAKKPSERLSAFPNAGQTQPSCVVEGQLLINQGLAL